MAESYIKRCVIFCKLCLSLTQVKRFSENTWRIDLKAKPYPSRRYSCNFIVFKRKRKSSQLKVIPLHLLTQGWIKVRCSMDWRYLRRKTLDCLHYLWCLSVLLPHPLNPPLCWICLILSSIIFRYTTMRLFTQRWVIFMWKFSATNVRKLPKIFVSIPRMDITTDIFFIVLLK